jgi:hypothetical protein
MHEFFWKLGGKKNFEAPIKRSFEGAIRIDGFLRLDAIEFIREACNVRICELGWVIIG